MIITPEMIARTSEHSHQTAVFVWASQSGIPELRFLFAIPNGGLRDGKTAGKLKAEGVKAGVPDILFPVKRFCYSGLFIEMKIGRNKPSPEQNEWMTFLYSQGYKVEVCYGWEQARDTILKYLGKM